MKTRDEFLIFVFIAICFLTAYSLFSLPTQVLLNGTPSSPQLTKRRGWTGFIGYLILTVSLSILLWKTYLAWQLQKKERKRILQYFGLYVLFYMLATLSMTIETGIFNLVFQLTYPLSIPISILFSGFAPFFLLKFNYWVVKLKKPETIRKLSVLLPLATLLGVMILQRISVISRGMLLAVNLIAVIQVMIFVSKELLEQPNALKKGSLQTLFGGLIFSLGFFLFYTLDALNPYPYSIYMVFAFISGTLASILLYLGTVMPEWYVSWIHNHAD